MSHLFRSEQAKKRFERLYQRAAEAWPVPSTTRIVRTSQGETLVRVSGLLDGPPLVLLHGVNGNSLQWIPSIEAFSETYKTFAVDGLYDCGLSVYHRPPSGPGDFVRWLDELFDGLGLKESIRLAGLSYGGWQAVQYALHFPRKLHKLVLLAPAGTVLPIRKEWLFRAALCAIPHRRFARNFLYWILRDAVNKDEATRTLVDAWVNISYAAMRSYKPRRLVNPAVLRDEELRSLQVPTLFLVGENEKLYPAREAVRRLNAVAPQIQTEIIPSAGHDLILAQPGIVHRKILDFLVG